MLVNLTFEKVSNFSFQQHPIKHGQNWQKWLLGSSLGCHFYDARASLDKRTSLFPGLYRNSR